MKRFKHTAGSGIVLTATILAAISLILLTGCVLPYPAPPQEIRWPAGDGQLLDTNGVPVQVRI